MPIYEYVCDAGHESETRQSMDDEPLEVCPEEDCGAPAERKMSAFSGASGSNGGGASCGTGDGGAPT
jgi:putative FmdB family regulatory protein